MASVFVSYRRDDSQGFAGRLADDLSEIFGAERVFRDIEIPVGKDFTDELHRAIAASDALLVVIGPRWASFGEAGYGQRLFHPTDWVRTEIEAAFAQRKRVLPVLVGEAKMPAPEALPPSIARLSYLQAAVLHDRDWAAGVARLADQLRALCPGLRRAVPPGKRNSPADVLREVSEHFTEEAARRTEPRRTSPGFLQRLLERLALKVAAGLGNLLKLALALAAIYIGIRLFGDEAMLKTLDEFEARLRMGWRRLLAYLDRP